MPWRQHEDADPRGPARPSSAPLGPVRHPSAPLGSPPLSSSPTPYSPGEWEVPLALRTLSPRRGRWEPRAKRSGWAPQPRAPRPLFVSGGPPRSPGLPRPPGAAPSLSRGLPREGEGLYQGAGHGGAGRESRRSWTRGLAGQEEEDTVLKKLGSGRWGVIKSKLPKSFRVENPTE